MSHDELIDQIVHGHEAVAEAEQRVNDLSAERREFVQAALAANVGAQAIADALNVSRPRVYKLASKDYR